MRKATPRSRQHAPGWLARRGGAGSPAVRRLQGGKGPQRAAVHGAAPSRAEPSPKFAERVSGPGISVHLGGVLAAADDESSLPFALLLHSITRTIHWKELEFDGGFALAIFHDGVLTTLQSYENSRVEVFTSMSILPRALANSSTSECSLQINRGLSHGLVV